MSSARSHRSALVRALSTLRRRLPRQEFHDLAGARALEAAEARQRLILDLLDEGVVLHHRDHGLVEVNDGAERMLGVSAGAGTMVDQLASRMRPFELDGTPVAADEMPSVRALRTGRADRRRQLELRAVDGSTSMFVEVDTVPTGFDAAGRATMALSTFRNVTEARTAASALAASEQRFRLLADNTRDLVTMTDGGDGFAYVSPSVQSVLGWTPSDVIDRRLDEVLQPEELELIRRASSSGDVVCHQFTRADGSRRWLETIAHEVTDGGGRTAVISSSRDVTDRVLAEQALLAERIVLDTCLAHLHSGVLAIDRHGRVLHVNRRHCELWELEIRLGDSLASLRARTSLLDEHGAPWSGRRPFDLALDGVPLADTPARIGRSDGSQLDIVISAEPLRDGDGEVTGAVMTVHDVTDLRTAERTLRELASVDQLTGLPNRRRLLEHIEHAVERCRRHPDRLLVCFIDLDGFKGVNDRLGHEAGDELLSQAAVRITAAVRTGDFVARLGGDEFIVVAEDVTSVDDGPTVARRIEEALLRPFELSAGTACIGASVGIRALRAGDTTASLLAAADRAMYLRKSRRERASVRPG